MHAATGCGLAFAVGVDLVSGGRGRTAREGTVNFTVWTWPHSSPPSRIHRTIDSMPGEAAHHRPWAYSTLSAAADFGGQWKNKACTINDLDRDPWPGGVRPASDADAPSYLTRSSQKPLSQRLLLQLSSGLPLRATLRELLQQQGGDVSVFDEWLQQAAEWDGYSKRDKEAAPLLVHLLKTGPQEPRGFAAGLTLKPHQLQALALMQAAEARPLGFNNVVWREVTLAGRSWWVSLATNKISSSPPPKQATGGILALEMGLGKTLCCLAVILANPAPAFGPGNTAPGCFLPDEALLQQPDGDAAADDDAKSCDEDEADEEAEEADAAAGEPAAAAAAAAAAAVESGGAAEGDGEAQQQGEEELAAAGEDARGRQQEQQQDEDVEMLDAVDHHHQQQQQQQGVAGQQKEKPQGSPGQQDRQQQCDQAPGTGEGTAAVAAAGGTAAGTSTTPAGVSAGGGSAAGAAAAVGEAAAGTATVAGLGPLRLRYSRATLVVCAVSLVGQWADEADRRTAGNMRICQYHGSGRFKYSEERLATDFDMVVTTYSILCAEFGGKRGSNRFSASGSPLSHIKWHRIIFNEGHVLKSKATGQSRAACSLVSDRRWIVTGTPIDSEVEEFHGLLLALQVWPFTGGKFASQHLSAAFKGANLAHSLAGAARQMPLLHLLRSVTVRYTKEVLELPPKTVEDVPVYLNAAEKAAYGKAWRSAKQQWEVMRSSASAHRCRLRAMTLLQLMRRICSGGRLSERALTVQDFAAEAAAADAAAAAPAAAAAAAGEDLDESVAGAEGPAGAAAECGVCLDAPEVPMAAPCGHVFCKGCIIDALKEDRRCPQCALHLTLSALRPLRIIAPVGAAASAAAGTSAAAAAAGLAVDEGLETVCDSKLQKLRQELLAMRQADATAKALIFSSFQPTVDFLKQLLPGWGFSFRYINGAMAMHQRTRAIEAFQQDPPTTVFILTLRSHICLLEPCLNPAVEAEAIGRAHRMGQSRAVVVKRLYVKGSVEERTMDLSALLICPHPALLLLLLLPPLQGSVEERTMDLSVLDLSVLLS
uniref:RING-type domain-containing protein n=1 Tax=Tetradesmus obliquus TaxID=3088 RepID=A0A383VNT4_TETOB|eukprot:jgi/Sobl393_1/16542/SZX66412.1